MTDAEYLLDIADRIERVSRERITGEFDLPDAEALRAIAARLERRKVERPSFDAGHSRRIVEDTNADPEGCNRGCGRKAVRQVPVFGVEGGPGLSASVCEHDDCTPGSGLVDMHRDELPISSFARRVMRGLRCVTLAELSEYGIDAARQVKGAGPKGMGELVAVLARAGLTFAGGNVGTKERIDRVRQMNKESAQ